MVMLSQDFLPTALAVLLLAAHLATCVLTAKRCAPDLKRNGADGPVPPMSIIRPVKGIDPIEQQTLASTFDIASNQNELIFCVGSPTDPVIPYIQELIATHPAADAKLLFGEHRGATNPKLDNIRKGWLVARHDWVILSDSNVMLPLDFCARLHESWTQTTGLVCVPPIGSKPESFWAHVECAFLNTHQARWQYASDSAGFGFAQGKSMLWRKRDLDEQGGLQALASEVAEDAAATKLVRSVGRRVSLASPPFFQPLGARSRHDVLARQVRWSQLRAHSFPAFYGLELLTGLLPMLACLIASCWIANLNWIATSLLVCATAFVWYGAEGWLAWRAGWPLAWQTPFSFAVRDLLIPAIWMMSPFVRRYNWRGNTVVMPVSVLTPATMASRQTVSS
jgi:ceramide glucosyltransferase